MMHGSNSGQNFGQCGTARWHGAHSIMLFHAKLAGRSGPRARSAPQLQASKFACRGPQSHYAITLVSSMHLRIYYLAPHVQRNLRSRLFKFMHMIN